MGDTRAGILSLEKELENINIKKKELMRNDKWENYQIDFGSTFNSLNKRVKEIKRLMGYNKGDRL